MASTKTLMSISSRHLGLDSPTSLVMHSLEYQQWLNDTQAQSEYQQWLRKEQRKQLPDPIESLESNLIFGEIK